MFMCLAMVGCFKIFVKNEDLQQQLPVFLGLSAVYILRRFLPKEEEEKKDGNQKPTIKTPPIKLMTPKEIDGVAAELGDVKCDCGFIDETDVVNVVEHRESAAVSEDYTFSAALPLEWIRLIEKNIPHMLDMNCYMREFFGKSASSGGKKGTSVPFVRSFATKLFVLFRHSNRRNEYQVHYCTGRSIRALVRHSLSRTGA